MIGKIVTVLVAASVVLPILWVGGAIVVARVLSEVAVIYKGKR